MIKNVAAVAIAGAALFSGYDMYLSGKGPGTFAITSDTGTNSHGLKGSIGGVEPETPASAVAAVADPDAPRPIKDNVIAYKVGDPGMEAARKQAHAQLPTFHKMWDSNVPGTYTLKFPLTQNGATEHIWMQLAAIDGGKYVGLLSNKPENGTDYKMGDKIVIGMDQIEDWMVQTDDGWYGGYTARYMLKDAPEAQRKEILARFRD